MLVIYKSMVRIKTAGISLMVAGNGTHPRGAYICSSGKRLTESKIEKQLLERIQKDGNEFMIEAVKPKAPPKNNDKIKDRIALLERKIVRLKDLFMDELLDKETYRKDYTTYMEELNNLKPLLYRDDTPAVMDLSLLKEVINTDYRVIYDKLTKEEKRRFWFSLLDRVYLENGSVISLKFLV